MSRKNQVCGLISFSLKVTSQSSNPFLTTLGQGKVRDHQYSFYNSYTFKNIIRIGLRYNKTKKYPILSPTLVLTQVCRSFGNVSYKGSDEVKNGYELWRKKKEGKNEARGKREKKKKEKK